MAKSFRGVAFWTVSTTQANWAEQAYNTLAPLEAHGLGKVSFDVIPAGEQVTVTFEGDGHMLLVNAGSGRGMIRDTESSSRFLVCLVAIRKAIGDLSLVSDSQETVPTLPRPSYPLYGKDWPGVESVAKALGLISNVDLRGRYPSVFRNIF